MADTIRDVVIRMSIETGDMAVGAIDVTKFKSSVQSVIDDLKRQFASIGDIASQSMNKFRESATVAKATVDGLERSLSVANQPGPSAGVVGQNWANRAPVAAGGPAIGRLGYGQSVRDRASAAESRYESMSDVDRLKLIQPKMSPEEMLAITKMGQMGQRVPFTDADKKKITDKLTKEETRSIRENDRESAASARDAQAEATKAIQETTREQKNAEEQTTKNIRQTARLNSELTQVAESGLARFGRGMALLGVSMSGHNRELAQSVVRVQGYYDAVRGGLDLLSRYEALQRQVSMGSGGGGVGGMNVAGAARGLAGAGVGTAVGAGAVVALAEVTRHMIEVSLELNRRYWEGMTADAERATRRSSVKMNQDARNALEMSGSIINTGPQTRASQNIVIHEMQENKRRQIEADRNMTPAQKQEYRRYSEGLEGRYYSEMEAQDEQKNLTERIKVLDESKGELDFNYTNAKGGFRNQRKSAQTELETNMNPPWHKVPRMPGTNTEFLADMINLPIGALNHFRGMNEQTRKEGVQEKIKGIDAGAAKNDADYNRRNAEIDRERLSLVQKRAQAQLNEYHAIRDSLQAARDRVHADKEMIRANEIGFGSMSRGDQAIQMRLQAKHERIKAQREANIAAGREENEGVERYTDWEKTQRRGGISEETMERQDIEDAQRAGFKGRSANADTLRDKEKEVERLEGMQPRIEELKQAIADSGNRAAQEAKELVSTMKEVFTTNDKFENLKRELEDLAAKNKEEQNRRSRTWGLF